MDLEKLQRKYANKSAAYWANMRSNLNLVHRSKVVDETTLTLLRNELSDILDSGILTYPHTLEQVGITPDMAYSDKKLELGLKKTIHRSEEELVFLKSMAYKADNIRKSNWAWRIGQEATEMQEKGWHPFFVTLTVDPMQADPQEIWQEGREFRKYIRRLSNVVCKELGHPPAHKKPYRPESDYVKYAGVIEHGKSREHHHGHFVIWLRAVPPNWRKCPNAGIRNPANRTKNECLPMRTLWPWSLPGLSPALYFRSIGDVWETKYAFTLPLKDGKPMKISTPRTAGNYITKYLAKEHKEWHHRMKATRNLGMTTLKEILATTKENIVEALTWRASSSKLNLLLIMTHGVPLGLMRSIAKQQHYLNKFKSNQLDLSTLLQSNSNIFTNMLHSVRHGQRPDRMHSLDFFDWVGRFLPVQRGYSETVQVIANTYIGTFFPPDKSRINHIKLPGNDIGYS